MDPISHNHVTFRYNCQKHLRSRYITIKIGKVWVCKCDMDREFLIWRLYFINLTKRFAHISAPPPSLNPPPPPSSSPFFRLWKFFIQLIKIDQSSSFCLDKASNRKGISISWNRATDNYHWKDPYKGKLIWVSPLMKNTGKYLNNLLLWSISRQLKFLWVMTKNVMARAQKIAIPQTSPVKIIIYWHLIPINL